MEFSLMKDRGPLGSLFIFLERQGALLVGRGDGNRQTDAIQSTSQVQ